MTSLLAIDPGLRTTGWACFSECPQGTWALFDVGLSRCTSRVFSDVLKVHDRQVPRLADGRVVVEKMQIYDITKSKADPEDLVNLSILGGHLAQHGREATFVEPRTWKGQRPKNAMLPLLKKYLSEIEFLVMESKLAPIRAKSLLHNAHEAVGIGLWALGRWPR